MTQATQTQPPLFDRKALTAHRARRKSAALFLHETVRDEVEDRLSVVNRTFKAPAIVTPFAEIWQNSLPGAILVPDNDLLALEPGAHDVVIHAMCLHWANDPVGQLIQCRRALKEDGLMLVLMLGGQTLHELRSSLAEAETTITGGLTPRVVPMGEIRDLGALLQRAGLALPVADRVPLTAEYRDLMHLMHDLRDMGETNALSQRQKHPTSRLMFDMADHLYRQHFGNSSNRLPATFEIVCLTGWSPSDNQQQPLRPGSAQSRLADALKVPETNLPE